MPLTKRISKNYFKTSEIQPAIVSKVRYQNKFALGWQRRDPAKISKSC